MSRPAFLRHYYKASLCSALVLTSLLMGCSDLRETRSDIKSLSAQADQQLQQINQQNAAETLSPLTVEDSPWFGNQAVPVEKGEILPSTLENDQALVITFDQPLTIDQVAARIQAATNIRVMVQRGQMIMPAGGGVTGALDPLGDVRFLPADGLEVSGGRMVWQGSLSSLLDQIADRFDAEWTYNGKAIQISQHITRTYMLHSLAGTVDIGGSVTTGPTSSESGLPQQSLGTVAKMSIWEEIQHSIENIIGTKARASFSPATGTITVSGYPSAVRQVEDYLRMQNKLRLRRVAVETRVLSVDLKKGFQNALDLDVVFKEAFNNQGFRFTTVADTADAGGQVLSGGVLSALPGTQTQGSAAVTNAKLLASIADNVTVEHTGSLVTLSDQPAPLQVATKKDYVKRVSASTAEGGTTTSIEPGTIDIGLTMNVLPHVIEQDRVMLRIALGITDLVGIQPFTSGQSSVQLPEVEATGFLQNTVLQSGETLVLAGFERKNASEQASGTGHPWNILLGGRQAFNRGREVRVLLITARVLPEEPMQVVQPTP